MFRTFFARFADVFRTFFGRTDLIIGESGAKKCQEAFPGVHFCRRAQTNRVFCIQSFKKSCFLKISSFDNLKNKMMGGV